MKWKGRGLLKLFGSYLCLLIPILIACVMVTNIVSDRMEKLESEEALQQVADAAHSLQTLYDSYWEESTLMAQRADLAKHNMVDNYSAHQGGLDMLRYKKFFDNRIYNIFVDYKTDRFYSNGGVGSHRSLFEQNMKLNEESVQRAYMALEKNACPMVFLYSDSADVKGYALFSFYFDTGIHKDTTICYTITLEELFQIFDLNNDMQWYHLTTSDGNELSFGKDPAGEVEILGRNEIQSRIENGRYRRKEETLESLGLHISLYYEKNGFKQENGLYQMQILNVTLLIIAVILSALLSWRLGLRRLTEVRDLEKLASGEMVLEEFGNGLYGSLKDIIMEGRNENQLLEARIQERSEQIREKNAHLIFGGLLRDNLSIEAAFLELGYEGAPKKYFVGAVCAQKDELKNLHLLKLRNCLCVLTQHNMQDVMVFLYDLKSEEEHYPHRKQLAKELRENLRRNQKDRICIGMSRIYRDSLCINSAYREAVSVLDQVLEGRIRDYFGCWENVVQDTQFVLPDSASLQQFSEMLRNGSYEDAMKILARMLNDKALSNCTAENQEFIRYNILHCLVSYFQEENSAPNNACLTECLGMNLKDAQAFEKSVTNMLRRCMAQEDTDNFSKMLEYIDRNYARNDLSYEEVAEYGKVSKTYISKLFRSRIGMSYIEYLTNVRLEKACALLRTTDLGINDIIRQVGYENA